MRYIRFDMDGPEVHLYPIVCWHLGAKQSSEAFIAEVIRQIKDDPLGKWIYMGDGGECVIKASKGNIYEQTMSPGDQLRAVADLLQPIKDKGLFGIRGNHGNRIDKETGLGWDEVLCHRIGVPYLGVSAIASIGLRSSNSHLSVSVYTHHGSASAISPGGKMNAAHKPDKFILADVLLTAHTHACGEAWPPKHYAYVDNRERRIKWHTSRLFVCGSAYDSRSGYAEEKMYDPLLPAHMVINLKAVRPTLNGERMLQLDVSSRKIEGFSELYTNREELGKWSSNSLCSEGFCGQASVIDGE
jgi:hypothetical protein